MQTIDPQRAKLLIKQFCGNIERDIASRRLAELVKPGIVVTGSSRQLRVIARHAELVLAKAEPLRLPAIQKTSQIQPLETIAGISRVLIVKQACMTKQSAYQYFQLGAFTQLVLHQRFRIVQLESLVATHNPVQPP
jgi:hypothetical protein